MDTETSQNQVQENFCRFKGDFDEEFEVGLTYYRSNNVKYAIYCFSNVIFIGIPFLILRWFPQYQVFFNYTQTEINQATHVNIQKFKNGLSQSEPTLTNLTEKLINGQKVQTFQLEFLRFYINQKREIRHLETSFEGLTQKQIYRAKCLQQSDVQDKLNIYGENIMDIEIKPIWELWIDEVLTPFNLFQLFALILWAYDNYLYYSMLILFLTLIQMIQSLWEMRSSLLKIRKMIMFKDNVIVVRDDREINIESNQLVPGDLIKLKNQSKLPCDAILIKGNAIVNEAILTGESIPINKVALEENEYPFRVVGNEASMLYAGTYCLRQDALAIVYKTGFNTIKGSLARSIMFNKSTTFSFERDSRKYLIVLLILAAALAALSIYLSFYYEVTAEQNAIWALEIITVVIPPALPTALAAGISLAIHRLKKQQISTVKPDKVNVSAKVNVCAFDKTGTITELYLSVLGCRSNQQNGFGRQKDLKDAKGDLLECFASCHSLLIDQDILQGDPLDLSMFQASGFIFEDTEDLGVAVQGKIKLNIKKRYDFIADLQRMSVIVAVEDKLKLFCKGSPEMIKSISDQFSIPQNYQNILEQYTLQGFRVIACAMKIIKDMSLRREEHEKNLNFIGFLIFENQLKPESTRVIKQLQEANLKTLMVTGDNPFTAINISLECGILREDKQTYLGEIKENKMIWSEVQLQNQELIEDKSVYSLHKIDRQNCDDDNELLNHQLVITGQVFDELEKQFESDKERVQAILQKTLVFARMKPNHKGDLMKLLQRFPDTYISFCGDGTNDTCALRQADVGLALSIEDASLAAPFSSQVQNITGVVHLLVEGRASLVTSIECFKFLTVYAVVQSIGVILCYFDNNNFQMLQFMYCDLFMIVPFAITMAMMPSIPTLAKYRPCADLISFPVISSVLVFILFSCGTQVGAFYWMKSEPWFTETPDEYDELVANQESSILLLVSSSQVFAAALAFTQGPPFRDYFFKNYYYIFWVIVVIIIQILLTLFIDDQALVDINLALGFDYDFRTYLVGYQIGIVCFLFTYEKIITQWLVKRSSLLDMERHKKIHYRANQVEPSSKPNGKY